jgi:hypothetical protein
MGRTKNLVIAVLLVALAEVFLTMTRPGQALASNVANVFITNSSLPVTGTVNVGNLPASQTVTGNVTATLAAGSSIAVTDRTSLTHVHQPVSQLVTLVPTQYCVFLESHCDTTMRINPDGSTDGTPFTVPAGYELVITDVTWLLSGAQVSSLVAPQLDIQTGFNQANNGFLNYFLINLGSTTSDANGNAGGSVHMTTGVAVPPGGSVHVNFGTIPFSNVGTGTYDNIVILGYLASLT